MMHGQRSLTLPSSGCQRTSEAIRCGVGGAKGGTKGNGGSAKHAPDSELGSVSHALDRIRQSNPAFAWRHKPRWEPYAASRTVRICAGGARYCVPTAKTAGVIA